MSGRSPAVVQVLLQGDHAFETMSGLFILNLGDIMADLSVILSHLHHLLKATFYL